MPHSVAGPVAPAILADLRARAAAELRDDILPFWERHVFDADGWMVGSVRDDLSIDNDMPRHSVIIARVLWTFSAAAQAETDPAERERWLAVARKALNLIVGPCWDHTHGGVFWSLAPDATPASDRKQVYAQAFAIYGLVEWHAATGDQGALARAWELFALMEQHSLEPQHGGYLEAHSREWGQLDNMALSDRDLSVPKSMNTNLHVLEAYTSLLNATGDARVRGALRGLLGVSLDHIYGDDPWPHCRLFFDTEWNSVIPDMSYGHDIEASWLLWEAALAVDDAVLTARTRAVTLDLADAVLAHGVDADGGVMYEGIGEEITVPEKHWWPQAEGVVGWLNAYQMTGEGRYAAAAIAAWDYIEAHVIDREHGEWFAVTTREGEPLLSDPSSRKMGPWKCPYHNGRACLEVLRRVTVNGPVAW